MPSGLTGTHVEQAIAALPQQGQILLKLLLLQYFDLTDSDIDHIAADRPDPRLVSGAKSTAPMISRETLDGIANRLNHYRAQVRQRRERAWWRMECLRKQIALDEAWVKLAERLLPTRFDVPAEDVRALRQNARAAVHKPMLRELDRRWDSDDITEQEYQRQRLQIEYQVLLRRLEREQKRLDTAKRDFETAGSAPVMDHEICHIWGLPAGTFAARKVKYLHQYLQHLQTQLSGALPGQAQAMTVPVDLWRETFRVLGERAVERSVALYDGLEGTEANLLDKLTQFAAGKMPEDQESRFWMSIIQESRSRAEYGSTPFSLFGLQRLSAILDETDLAMEALEADLLARVSPTPKETVAEGELEKDRSAELGQIGEHVLRSMLGEER